jgi:two-component system cell cycle sensor histidine kinase/response regulator CckA
VSIGIETLFQQENSTCFELLFERHPLPMWVFDQETFLFLAVNAAAVEKYGYGQQEFLTMALDQIVCADDLEKMLEAYAPARTEGVKAGRSRPCRHKCKDGTLIESESSWTSVTYGHRAVIVAVINDLTMRKRIEESNREQVRLLDMASDAIIVCDLGGGITFWNQGAERLYGWKAEEALGTQMVDMLCCDVRRLAETEAGVRETGEWSGELKQKSKDGRDLIVNSRWTLVKDEAGEGKSVLVINTDLTETKKLETQFLRTQRLESIGTLASGIAHDLNNILSPILMSVAVLRRSTKAPDAEKMLNIIEGSAERGAGIVKQVLTFARGVEGERVLLQPKHLLGEMGKILAQTFPRNIDLQSQFPADLWTVMGDATQLHQVLLNLCVNARDAMTPKGGVLTLAAENVDVDQHFAKMNPGAQLGPHVVLRVGDTGSGMSPETMDKIFDPFFTTKEVGKGTGLGLATVMGIVKSHGGFITVQSEPNVGTTFRIFLPSSGSSVSGDGNAGQDQVRRGNGELVLVVDDEAPIREALVQTLEDYGYRAYTAEDGSDALALYFQRRDEIKLVLTDLAMGQMDGIALVRALRKLDSDVRVIVSSGHCQPEQAILLEGLGVKTFLDKPYTAAKLMRALDQALNTPAAGVEKN